MDSFPKTIASLNCYRNERITTQLRILAPPLDFSALKKLSLGARTKIKQAIGRQKTGSQRLPHAISHSHSIPS